MLRSPTVLALLFASACVSSACTADGADGGMDGETGSGQTVDPSMGVWFYAEGDNVSDTCMVPGFMVAASTDFYLTNNGDGTLTVARDGQDIECTISASDFTCLPVPLDPTPIPNFDATLTLEVTYSGTFDSDASMTGQRDIDVTCTGADCQALGDAVMTSFPCELVDAFTGMLQ